MKFTCTQCEHSVSTLDFDARPLRTQAATVITINATANSPPHTHDNFPLR